MADAIDKDLTNADVVDGRVVVSGSFTGGNRCHVMNYQNTMAICKVYGSPDLFVSFTCDTKWREIWDALQYEPGQKPCDRADLILRIFHMKYNKFIANVRDGKTFDPVCAGEACYRLAVHVFIATFLLVALSLAFFMHLSTLLSTKSVAYCIYMMGVLFFRRHQQVLEAQVPACTILQWLNSDS